MPEKCQKMLKNAQKMQKMPEKCQKMLKKGQKPQKNARKCQKMPKLQNQCVPMSTPINRGPRYKTEPPLWVDQAKEAR